MDNKAFAKELEKRTREFGVRIIRFIKDFTKYTGRKGYKDADDKVW